MKMIATDFHDNVWIIKLNRGMLLEYSYLCVLIDKKMEGVREDANS